MIVQKSTCTRCALATLLDTPYLFVFLSFFHAFYMASNCIKVRLLDYFVCLSVLYLIHSLSVTAVKKICLLHGDFHTSLGVKRAAGRCEQEKGRIIACYWCAERHPVLFTLQIYLRDELAHFSGREDTVPARARDPRSVSYIIFNTIMND